MHWLTKLALAWLLCMAFGVHAADSPLPKRVHEAVFTSPPAKAPSVVALPHTESSQPHLPSKPSRYLLHFDLSELPSVPWAARFERISPDRTVWLNGSLIELRPTKAIGAPSADVLHLPSNALRLGRNELLLELHHAHRGGLSQAHLGAHAALQDQLSEGQVWERDLPLALNMGLVLHQSVFMLLLYWWRRQERALASFGTMSVLLALNHCVLYLQPSWLPSWISTALMQTALPVGLILFGAFSLTLHADASNALRVGRTSLLWSLPFSVIAMWAHGPWAGVHGLAAWLTAWSLWSTWCALGAVSGWSRRVIVFGFALALVSGWHDHLLSGAWLDITQPLWLPYALPLALCLFVLPKLRQLSRALFEAERSNAELEQRVVERTHALESANAAKARFLSSASHDLRQPVAAIGLMVGMLREQTHSPDSLLAIDRVDQAVSAMSGMLRGLLDLSRLDAETVLTHSRSVPLQSLFDAIEIHEAPMAQALGLRLRFRPTPLWVQADPVLLEQILRNLVANGLRYTHQGGVLVSARARNPGRVLLQVWDTGVGIGEPDQQVVFDEFVQLGGHRSTQQVGLGLGLSIVRRSAQLGGHPLTLRSRPGRGSCFSITVPSAPALTAASPPFPHTQPATNNLPPERPLDGWHIALIEDNNSLRDTLNLRLKRWGAEVRSHSSFAALMAAVHDNGHQEGLQHWVEFLITDLRLPDGDGLDLVKAVQARCGPTPSLVITGDTAATDLQRLHDSALPVLHKPFTSEELLAAILQSWEVAAARALLEED